MNQFKNRAFSLAVIPVLMLSTCGGGGGSIRSTTPERVIREGSECITAVDRIRVSGSCTNTPSQNRVVRTYDDGNSPRYRECIGSNTSYSGCK